MAENNDFTHLPLPLLFQGKPKLRGGGAVSAQTKRNTANRIAHGSYVKRRSAELSCFWKERRAERSENALPEIKTGIPILLEIDPSADIDFLRGLGFEIVCEIEEGFIIVATEDVDLSVLNEKADAFVANVTARCNSPAKVYYLIRYTSFCEQVEVDGVLRDKYVRQTRREIDEGTVREVYEDSFPEPKSKPFTYVDDEYAERAIRCSRTYYEYAKDICENYRMDLRRYKLIRERKQYIGISNREAYQAMCEDLAFAQQSLKTVLNDYADLFRKRFSEGLSIRKAADAMQQNRGVIERRQAALYRAFAQLLQQRDEADGVCRLMQKIEYDQRDIEDLLE